MPDFKFDEAAHKYYLDGEELPSVTRILSPLNDFAGISPAVLQHAADRGTAVHKAIELFCNDELDEDSLCDEIKPYFNAFLKFYAEKKPRVISSEERVYHPTELYAGTMDLILDMPDRYFVDTKNTATISKTAGIQLIAYQKAKSAMNLESWYSDIKNNPVKRATLWLKNTGKYQLIVHNQQRYERDWQLFRLLLNKVHTDAAVVQAVNKWKAEKEK